jgi:hypothetical protein
MTSTVLAITASALLLITAGYHLSGLRQVSAGLSGERLGLTRAAWIGIAIDWMLIAAAWVAAAFQLLPTLAFGLGAALSFTSAIVVAATLGLRFPGVWLLGAASACAIAAQMLQ